ncbi:MAG: hypothetical protein ACRD1N_04915 [Terriglobia bacterium]
MAAEHLERLRNVNAKLAEHLDQIGRGTLPDLGQLTALVSQGGVLLDERRGDAHSAWQAQVEEYHQNLLKLKIAIEKLQSELEGRKDQLRAGGEQLRAFSKWIDALKDTR